MKRLLNSTIIVSMAFLPIAPLPVVAQQYDEAGRILAADGTILCEPTADMACDIEDPAIIQAAMDIQAQLDAQAQAEAEAQAQAEAEAQAQAEAEAQAQAEAEAQAQAEAEAQAQAEAEAQAQAEAEAQAQAEAEAAAQAEAEAQAQAEAEAQAQAEAEAAAQAEAEAQAQAEAEAEAEAQAQAEAEAQEQEEPVDTAGGEEADSATEEAIDPAQQDAIDAASAALADAQAEIDAEGRVYAMDGTVLCEPTPEAACDITDPAILQMAQEIQAGFDPEVAPEEETAAADETDPAQQDAIDAANAALADAQAEIDAEGRVYAMDGTVLCEPTPEAACDITDPAILQMAQEIQAGFDPEVAPEEETDSASAEAGSEADSAAQEGMDQAALDAAAAENHDANGDAIDPAANLVVDEAFVDPDAPLIDAPEISEGEAEALTTLLDAPVAGSDEAFVPEVAAPINETPILLADPDSEDPIDPALAEEALAALPAPDNTIATTVETIAPTATRSSAQEFKAAPKTVAGNKKTGLSDLERVGLFVLGAVVVGQVLDGITGRNTVVSNTGDRVVVQRPNGDYALLKDDDAILRQPGSTVRTETFNDGSSRTIVQRADGTQVVTIRDATGRVLRRSQYDRLGRELVLVDDFAQEVPVNPRDLPRPRITRSTSNATDAAIRAEIARREIARLNRGFSLRQIRDIPEVRALAAEVDVERVTFRSGSAAITPQQANALADLGDLMLAMLEENPAEMFLIEGHTDAVGSAAANLALSDRRAETVALALTEYFGIPPENMIVQGYGETELRIKTQRDEPRNRRVVVRIITPLLQPAG